MSEFVTLLDRFEKSEFRSRFKLRSSESGMYLRRGRNATRAKAWEIVAATLAPASPRNDGRQTPWHGDPIFVAQHGTATCCRACLDRWHGIPRNRSLLHIEQRFIVDLLMAWLERQVSDESQAMPEASTSQPWAPPPAAPPA